MSNDDKKKRRRGLGKGLSALLPQSEETTDEPKLFAHIAVEQIRPAADQPRKTFDPEALEELAASIKESGLIQPLVVREMGDGYELIAGERRWRACRLAGIEEIPVVIKDLTDEVAFTIALVENVQREDLSALEAASAFQRLIDEYGYTQNQVAQAVGKSRSAVANALRLLKLPSVVHELLEQEKLSAGHARALIPLPEEDAVELAEMVVRHGYSVRETEDLVREYTERDATDGGVADEVVPIVEVEATDDVSPATDDAAPSIPEPPRDNPQIRYVTRRLEQALGTKVAIQDRGGKGRVVVHYDNLEVLQDVLERIAGAEE